MDEVAVAESKNLMCATDNSEITESKLVFRSLRSDIANNNSFVDRHWFLFRVSFVFHWPLLKL
jgi:hypothetical protein